MAYNFPIEPEVRVSDIFFRTIAGIFGGGFGSLVLMIGVLLSGSFSSSYLAVSEEGQVHPLFLFILLSAIYLALLISSLASLTFFYYCDRERYAFLLSTLTHAFGMITLIFVVSTPLSLMVSIKNFEMMTVVGLILIVLGTIFSIITMEVIANHKHLLVTLYSVAIAMFSFLLVIIISYFMIGKIASVKTTSYIFILAFPICWGAFGFWQVSFEMIYQWIYQMYGSDFLNASIRVGSDYIKEQRMQKAE